jgi:hypothetical protein
MDAHPQPVNAWAVRGSLKSTSEPAGHDMTGYAESLRGDVFAPGLAENPLGGSAVK